MRRFLMVVAVLAAIPAVYGVTSWAGGTGRAAPDPDEEAALLRAMVERMVVPYRPAVYEGPYQPAEVLPGRLGGDLAGLPPPPDGRVVGSVVFRAADGAMPKPGTRVLGVVDAPGPPDEVAAFYRAALERRGWAERAFKREMTPSGGFRPQPELPVTRVYCPSEGSGRETAVDVVVMPAAGGSDVRITLLQALEFAGGPCPPDAPAPSKAPPAPPPGSDLIPPLEMPADARTVSASGTNQYTHRYRSDALAETEMTVEALEAFMAGQLAGAGWVRREGAAHAALAWSMWEIPDSGGWEGFLLVFTSPAPGTKVIHVSVASAEREQQALGAGTPPK